MRRKIPLVYFLLVMVCLAGPVAGDDYTWTKLFSGENSIFFMTIYGDELWHFSGRYLSYYNLDTHLNRSFTQDDGLVDPFPDQMAEGPDGALLVAGSNGISRYDGEKFTSYPRSLGPVTDMDFDDTGKLWLLCWNEGLVTFDISGYHADPIEDFTVYDYPEAMSFDQDGALWVSFAHYENGFSLVSRYDGASWQDYTVEDGLPNKYIQKIEQGELPERLQQAIEEGRITREQVEEMMKQGQQGQVPTAIPEDFQLREGLTVTVSIIVEQKSDVLLVPNSAITRRGQETYVQVLLPDGVTEERPITTGISDYQNTEVTGGLSEDEKVVVPQGTTSTATTSQQGPPMMIPGMGRPR